jgi:hypothetical protein
MAGFLGLAIWVSGTFRLYRAAAVLRMLVVAFRLWLSGFQPVSREPVAVWVPPGPRRPFVRAPPAVHALQLSYRALARRGVRQGSRRADPFLQFRLNRWLYALCWTGTDRPSVLFDRSITWLLADKVFLPGLTVLERAVAHVRSRANERLWQRLTMQVAPEQPPRLEQLLIASDTDRTSPFDRLRDGPVLQSPAELGLPSPDRLPPSRITTLAPLRQRRQISGHRAVAR